ncbi:MAG: hypothetical protein ACC662_09525, partial [Planctomycetota bacterium]
RENQVAAATLLPVGRVLDLLDARAADETDHRLDWRAEQVGLLAALGRTDDLAARIETWIAQKPGIAGNRWRLTLAFLHTEAGRLPEAAALF